ncbi:ABC transporter related protein (Precursor) [Nocardioides sp. PD653]|nr:ABC transporter related protein (Precursor) [Nocardioides sp. PD653-B2]GAW53804.1 ABC transporter related protein (Precursor) [Nocardioides sp. PD653]
MLETIGLTKRYGAVTVLSDVSLQLGRSSVLALVGENGAGKSTLLKIISGAVSGDGGRIRINSEDVSLDSPSSANSAGVATVYQELSLQPDMTVAENLFLGDYPRRAGLIEWKSVRRGAAASLDELGVQVPLDTAVGRLSLAEQYIVEIAKAVRHQPSILILDEPTAALDADDSERIFRLMDDLKARGTSMIFVSHRLSELYRVADSFVVLRDGREVASGRMEDAAPDDLVANMLGRRAQATSPARDAARSARVTPTGTYALEVRDLATQQVNGVSFSGRAGQVIGVAGLRGSGQSDLCRALVGAEPLTGGTMKIQGQDYRPRTPSQALRSGVAFVPVDRKTQGIFANLSVAQNISMCQTVKTAPRVIARGDERRIAEAYRDSLSIKLPEGRVESSITALSGGNQQKVVLAKCLASAPSVVVLSEPTRGVDISAKMQIHTVIKQLADEGMCVIVSSPEIEELTSLCSSVVVMHRGEMTAYLEADEINEHNILRFASGTES